MSSSPLRLSKNALAAPFLLRLRAIHRNRLVVRIVGCRSARARQSKSSVVGGNCSVFMCSQPLPGAQDAALLRRTCPDKCGEFLGFCPIKRKHLVKLLSSG